MTKIDLPEQRRVGHLTLLRQGRKITPAEYNALTTSEQLNIIHNAQGKVKYDLLINSKYIEKLVPQLHPQELYLTINELGAEYAVELLSLASPEQMTLLIDLDCWDGDTLSESLSLTWMQLLLATGEEKVCQLARQMEPELLALFLKKHLIITRGLEVYDDDDADNAKRLEALYDIQYSSEDAAKIIGALLKIWLEREQESYLLLMEMVRSENTSVLEEEVYQTRSYRLLDLGLIPMMEAKSIYSTIDPDTFVPGGKKDFSLEADTLQHPAALIAHADPNNLLAEILDGNLDHATACELLFLANRKMSADQTDLADTKAVTETFQQTYSTLNLALEYLAGTDTVQATQIFNTTYLISLFQLGHSLIIKYQRQAEAIAVSAVYPYFDEPELLFIDSLSQKVPALYQETFDSTESKLQPITSVKQLQYIEQRLQQIGLLVELFESNLPFSMAKIDEIDFPPTLSTVVLSAIANQLLDREFLPLPIDITELPQLKEMTFKAGQITPTFEQKIMTTMTKAGPNLSFFADFCLDAWKQFFSNLDELPTEQINSCVLLSKP